MTKNQIKNRIAGGWVGFVTVIVAVLITAGVSVVLYRHTVNLLTDNLRQRLLAIVTTGVVQFDAKDVEALQVEADWQKPEWARVVNQLKKIKDNNSDIIFAYIFRKKRDNPELMEFVSDAGSINPYANLDTDPSNDVDVDSNGVIDSVDYLQWPGQEYPEPPEDAYLAYDGPLTNRDLYEDAWGQVITGYAPIRNERGEPVAVLAVDIRANEFFTITRQTLIPFVLFIIALIGIICVLAWGLIAIWNKRIELVVELDRQKDELLSIVSHQLATPISSVKWYIEMMLDGDLGKVTQQQEEHLKSVQSVAADLSDLCSMILDVSRIQLGRVKVEPGPLDLNEFFKEILNVIEPRAKEKGVEFSVAMPHSLPTAMLDKRMTRMTIENLLSNAVKYTPKDGHVKFMVERHGDQLYCEVKDDGCGIPKKDQSQIFGKLFRASNVRNQVDGNGFGLYIAKGAIEAQGGKIWFESEEGKGTCFCVLLPLEAAQA